MYTREVRQSDPYRAVMLQGGVAYFRQAKHLGTAADAAGISTGLKAAAPYAAAIPVVGPVVSAALGLASLFHIGEGCGAACTDATDTVAPFELAGWNVELAATAGMITQAQAVGALQWLQTEAVAAMQSLMNDPKYTDSVQGVTSVIQAQIAAVQANNLNASDFSGEAGPQATPSTPIPVSTPTQALNPTLLQSGIFVSETVSTAHWPAGVPTAAQSLALQAIAQAAGVTASSSSSGIAGTVSALSSVTGLPEWVLLLGGVALVWAIL